MSDMPVINGPLMGQVAALIRANPERHYQGSWIDTATGWAGGYAAREAGSASAEELRQFISRPLPLQVADAARPICTATGCVAGLAALLTVPDGTTIHFRSAGYLMTLPGGEESTVEGWAQRTLGLTNGQRRWLFWDGRFRESVLNALDWLPAHPDATMGELDEACRAGDDDEDDE